jgi:hypothetical protein
MDFIAIIHSLSIFFLVPSDTNFRKEEIRCSLVLLLLGLLWSLRDTHVFNCLGCILLIIDFLVFVEDSKFVGLMEMATNYLST